MKLVAALALLSGPALSPAIAAAQPAEPAAIALSADRALLNVTAEGRSARAPDLAVLRAGVVTQAKTAGEAMAENARKMEAAIAALRGAGVADRDLRTATLSLQPQYFYPPRQPNAAVPPEPAAPRIVGYEARNAVTVRVRKVADTGRIVDALVGAGVNEIGGPSLSLDDPASAADEARTEALRTARQRAELYAREAGFRTVRILTISEGGGNYPLSGDVVVTARRNAGAGIPPLAVPPVQGGEVALRTSLSVQFLLER